jgi:hypothetical protein
LLQTPGRWIERSGDLLFRTFFIFHSFLPRHAGCLGSNNCCNSRSSHFLGCLCLGHEARFHNRIPLQSALNYRKGPCRSGLSYSGLRFAQAFAASRSALRLARLILAWAIF